MADLEIGPAPRQFVGPTPSFPSSAPVLEETQRVAQQTQETIRRATTLLLAINKQKEADASTGAVIDFHKRATNLNMGLDKIRDPETKFRLYQEGLTGAIDEVKKQYPNMSDNAIKTIEDQTNNYLQNYHHKMIADEWRRLEDNAKNQVKDFTLGAATATDDKTRRILVGQGLTAIDNLGRNGIWNPDRVAFEKGQFIYNYHKEMLNHLLAQGDDKSLNAVANFKNGQLLNGEPVNLKDRDVIAARSEALHQLNQKAGLAQQRFQQKQNQVLAGVQNGTVQPEQAAKMGIPKSKIDLYHPGFEPTGALPTDEELGKLANLKSYADSHNFASIDDFDNWVAGVESSVAMTPAARRMFDTAISERRKDLGDDFKEDNAEFMKSFDDAAASSDSNYGAGSDPHKEYFASARKLYAAKIRYAKTTAEKEAALEDVVNSFYSQFGRHIENVINTKLKYKKNLNPFETRYQSEHMKSKGAAMPTPEKPEHPTAPPPGPSHPIEEPSPGEPTQPLPSPSPGEPTQPLPEPSPEGPEHPTAPPPKPEQTPKPSRDDAPGLTKLFGD